MAANSENQINLKTLQRVDSNIIEIIDNTCQVAIYKYERKLEQWEGTDVEGTLFLYRRSASPYYGFIIVNRMNTTNFVECITSDMQFQLQEPYLLYKNTSDDIIGCWFYEHKDLKRISKKFQTIVLKQASSTPRRQRCASESETQPQRDETKEHDIVTLLLQAHDKYMKKLSQPYEPKINNSVDVNNLDSHPDKCHKKSVSGFKENPPRTHSQEVYPLSPRRRFMSTGSFDSHQVAAAVHRSPRNGYSKENKVLNTWNGQLANGCMDFASRNRSEHVVPRRLLPLFSHDEVSSANDQSIKKHVSGSSVEPFTHSQKSLFNENCEWKISQDRDAHFTSIKEVLKSHVQDNPDLMLQIHEAYISSLRSVFTKT